MEKIIFTILVWFYAMSCFSQNKIDSLQKLTKLSSDSNLVNVYNELSQEYSKNSKFAEAAQYAQLALDKSEQLNFVKGLAFGYKNLGDANYDLQNYELAITNLKTSIPYFIQLNNRKMQSFCLHLIGMLYRKISDFNQALDYEFKSLKIAEEMSNDIRISRTCNGIGLIYHTIEKYDEAIKYYQRFYDISEKLGDKSDMADALNNLGIVYKEKKNPDKGLDCYLKSMKIYEELNDTAGLARSYHNIGSIYLYQGNTKKAFDFLVKSLDIDLKLNNKDGIAYSYTGIADIYMATKDYKQAIEFKLLALKYSNEKTLRCHVFDSLSVIYSHLKDFENAYFFHLKYAELKDSLLNEKNDKQLNEIRIRFEVEKKDHENEALRNDKLNKETTIRLQKIAGIAITLVLIAVIGFAVLLFKSRKKIKTSNELLKQKNIEINHRNDEIQIKNAILEQQKEEISAQAENLELANTEITSQKDVIEKAHSQITSSINYASRIQTALFPSETELHKFFPDHFLLYLPKNIVSGDFYFVKKIRNLVYFAVADCTGHGVPGAMLCMLGIAYLGEIISLNQNLETNQILDELRNKIKTVLRQTGDIREQKDGMDIALCVYNAENSELMYTGANSSILIGRNGAIFEYKSDKQPIGIYINEKPFSKEIISIHPNDTLYLFSDGFTSQFGHQNNEKLKSKRLIDELTSIQYDSLSVQNEKLSNYFQQWRGNEEQTDDVTILSIRF